MSSEHSYVVLQVLEAFVLLELGGSQTLAHSIKCTHTNIHTFMYSPNSHTSTYVQQHSLRINTNKLGKVKKSEGKDSAKPGFIGKVRKANL